jgi:hypothetical protein
VNLVETRRIAGRDLPNLDRREIPLKWRVGIQEIPTRCHLTPGKKKRPVAISESRPA